MLLKSIKIDNFRGITQPSEVKGFNKLTVVVGPNNSGKSTLLESILLLCSREEGKFLEVFKRRGWFGNQTFKFTANNLDEFKFCGNLKDGSLKVVNHWYENDIPNQFLIKIPNVKAFLESEERILCVQQIERKLEGKEVVNAEVIKPFGEVEKGSMSAFYDVSFINFKKDLGMKLN